MEALGRALSKRRPSKGFPLLLSNDAAHQDEEGCEEEPRHCGRYDVCHDRCAQGVLRVRAGIGTCDQGDDAQREAQRGHENGTQAQPRCHDRGGPRSMPP